MHWLLWALLSAFLVGLTDVLAKMGMKGVNTNVAVAIRACVMLVVIGSAVTITQKWHELPEVSKRGWLFLVLSGVTSAFGWMCLFQALQNGEASRAVPVDKLSLIFAIAFAAAFLHEELTWNHWVGGGLMAVGAVVLALK